MHMKCLKVPAICTAHSLTLHNAYVQIARSGLGVTPPLFSKLNQKVVLFCCGYCICFCPSNVRVHCVFPQLQPRFMHVCVYVNKHSFIPFHKQLNQIHFFSLLFVLDCNIHCSLSFHTDCPREIQGTMARATQF